MNEMQEESVIHIPYAAPGVYIEEIDRRVRPIEAATTSVTAFIGITAEASRKEIDTREDGSKGKRRVVENLLNRVVPVPSWTYFVDFFGSFVNGAYLADAVYGHFSNGGDACYVMSLHAVHETPIGASKSFLTVNEIIGDEEQRTGLGGLTAIETVNLIVCPDCYYGYDSADANAVERVTAIQRALIDHCEKIPFRFAILDAPPRLDAEQLERWRETTNFDSKFAAVYYPWIEVPHQSGAGKKLVPPSGYITGVYHRSDEEYGVHKAPANEMLHGVVGLDILLTQHEHARLNRMGVNCLRAFPGIGIRIWGARTLSSDTDWRYINVRRLFNMIGESLDISLQWVVFEPNDRFLWALVRRDVSNFLRQVWQSGALIGATQEEAFYVKVDEEVNPKEVRAAGQLVVEIGIAPVKPAEFIILRLSQWAGADAEIEP